MLSLVKEQLEKLPRSEQAEAAIGLLRKLFLQDFYLFSKFFLYYKDIDKDVHGQFISVFESKATRKIVVMPRGTYKSTIGSVCYPIWRLLREPNLTILLDSELYTNSKNFIREIKGCFDSERMRMFFGDQVGSKWDETEIIIKSRTQNIKEASITAGGVGTTKVGQHYSLIIGDDLNSPQNSETPEKCQKVIDHMRYNLNILNPGGEYVFIGTRYAERDVIGFLLKEILGEHKLAEGKLELTTETLVKDESILGE
jgi:hypothetical protein